MAKQRELPVSQTGLRRELIQASAFPSLLATQPGFPPVLACYWLMARVSRPDSILVLAFRWAAVPEFPRAWGSARFQATVFRLAAAPACPPELASFPPCGAESARSRSVRPGDPDPQK